MQHNCRALNNLFLKAGSELGIGLVPSPISISYKRRGVLPSSLTHTRAAIWPDSFMCAEIIDSVSAYIESLDWISMFLQRQNWLQIHLMHTRLIRCR